MRSAFSACFRKNFDSFTHRGRLMQMHPGYMEG
jgi:hypothetical protein